MRPGQSQPNDFELAILERLAVQKPSLRRAVDGLIVLSREFTGVGSFTKFKCDESTSSTPERQVGLDGLIRMPGVPNGLGAVLFYIGEQLKCLEVYTYGDEHWDGAYDGFSILETT